MQFCSHIIVPRTLQTALMMSQCLLNTMDAASKQDVDTNHSTQQESVGKYAGATSLRILCYIHPTPTNTYRQVLGTTAMWKSNVPPQKASERQHVP